MIQLFGLQSSEVEFLFFLAILGGTYFVMTGSSANSSSTDSNVGPTTGSYPDVAAADQGGSYKLDFDDAFQAASDKMTVPWALIKAHAVRESALDPHAYRAEPARGSRPPSASYGLTQILWWQNSNRFKNYGYSDDIVGDGSILYDPTVNAIIGASIMRDNLKRFGNLRDAINAYNTGVGEATRVAPGNYVDNVLSIYSTLVGRDVS